MNMITKVHLALLGAATACAISPAVHSQTATNSDTEAVGLLEEIVVTAQKREENLQKVSASVQLVQREDIERKGITNLDQALKQVAGVKITSAIQGNDVGYVFIRGIGNNNTDPTEVAMSQAVVVNVNGISNSLSTAVSTTMFDVERVEVLRGPQGTLYGAGAEGGAINIVTAQPKHEFEVRARAQFGNYNARNLEAILNVPLGSKLAVRLTGSANIRDGFYKGRGAVAYSSCAEDGSSPAVFDPTHCTGSGFGTTYDANGAVVSTTAPAPGESYKAFYANNYGARDVRSYRAMLKYDPTDQFSVTGTYEHSQNKTTNQGITWGPDLSTGNYYYDRNDGQVVWSSNESDLYALNFNVQLGNVGELIFIPTRAVRKQLDAATNQATGSQPIGQSQTQSTYELRLESLPSSKIKWNLGLYVLDASSGDVRLVDPAASPANGNFGFIETARPADNKALFGQVTYPFTDRLRGVVGLREARVKDTWQYALYKTQHTGAGADVLDANGQRIVTAQEIHEKSNTSNSLTYKLGVEFDLMSDAMAYAMLSTGYKPGGFSHLSTAIPNSSLITSNDYIGTPFIYKAEDSINYELGLKSRWLDNTLQINGDVYYNTWKKMQFGGQYCRLTGTYDAWAGCPTLANGQQYSDLGYDNSAIIINAISPSNQYGLELETTWVPTPADRLMLNLSSMHGTYGHTRYITPVGSALGYVDLGGHEMSNSPALSGTFSYAHDFKLPNGTTLTPRLDESFSTHYENTHEFWWGKVAPFNGGNGGSATVPGYGHTDISITLAGKKWSANLYGNNLFNSVQQQFAFPPGALLSEPRIYGVSVTASY